MAKAIWWPRPLTDVNGNYIFNNLTPGVYSLHEHQPAGYYDHDAFIGSGDGVVLDPNDISSIDIGSDKHLVNYVFCEWLPRHARGQRLSRPR